MEKGNKITETSTFAYESNTTNQSIAADKDRVRIEFYAKYDVMTGVRIAATLGGFFALMVFLIVYKSRSKTVKALNDPKIVELAEAVVAEEEAEEEERQLTAALESALAEQVRSRQPLGEIPIWTRSSRFSSIGSGYGSLLMPPRRLSSLRGNSLPTSELRFDTRLFLEGSEKSSRRICSGPVRDRRFSSATCSSSGSSYLERRGSSVVCALTERRLSPCPSEHEAERLAPLASVGSFGPSFTIESEPGSVGADSVFAEDDNAASTDDEIEQFSTDSGGGEVPPRKIECTEMSSRSVTSKLEVESASRSQETLF